MDENRRVLASTSAAAHATADDDGEGPTSNLDPHQPPTNEVSASVAFDAVLASTDGYAIFCAGLQVYSTGVRMNLELRARDARGHERLFDAFHGSGPDQVLLGVEFADGRRGTNHGWGSRCTPGGDGVMVIFGGGGGSDDAVDAEFFVAPLPPPGPAKLVCAWPARGIADTVTDLPVDEILGASARVHRLWPPRQRADEDEVEEPLPPAVPDESWFAR